MNRTKSKLIQAIILFDAFTDDDIFDDDLDSSSEDEDEELHTKKYLRYVAPDNFDEFSDSDFLNHFRINRTLFEFIASKFAESEEYRKYAKSKVYSAKKHMAVFLWFAGHKDCSYRSISKLFKISLSTVHALILRVSYFISSLSDTTFKWPNHAKKNISAENFASKHGFPGIIGCIGRTRVVFRTPKRFKDEYLGKDNNCSIWVQGICDENRKFLNVSIGLPGSAHVSRVFKESEVCTQLSTLCEEFHLLGDASYPCSSFLLTPYKDGVDLAAKHRYFNKCLESHRVAINSAFRMLVQRFPQLFFCKLDGADKICHVIRACCVLHNLSSESEIEFKNLELTAENYQNVISADNRFIYDQSGGSKRDQIMEQIFANKLENK